MNPKEKCYVKINSTRVAPVGKYTHAYGIVMHSEICRVFNEDQVDEGIVRRKFKENEEEKKLPTLYQNLKDRELQFVCKLAAKNLRIKEVAGDGNCLFRSIADQLYGSEDYHDLLRKHCMDYISIEKELTQCS